MTVPAPAATVILLRDAAAGLETLLLRRNSKLAFHGGAWVFPGGRVDPEDLADDGEVEAARRTAAREAHEEAGIVLDASTLLEFSHWTTPDVVPKRFATWFFLGVAPEGQVTIDGGEIHDHAWFTPEAALAARAAGEIELPPPTFVSLDTLRPYGRVADVLERLRDFVPPVFEPRLVQVDGGMCSLYPGDAGWESQDPSRAGSRHRLLMLETGWAYERG